MHDLVGSCEFDVDGAGSWTVHIDHGALRVTEGPDPGATVRVRFDRNEFVRVARGDGHENLVTAVLRGEILDFQGNLAFAQRLQCILPLPADRRST